MLPYSDYAFQKKSGNISALLVNQSNIVKNITAYCREQNHHGVRCFGMKILNFKKREEHGGKQNFSEKSIGKMFVMPFSIRQA